MWEAVQEVQRLEQLIGQLQSVIGLIAVRLAEVERQVEDNWKDGVRDYEDLLERIRTADQQTVIE